MEQALVGRNKRRVRELEGVVEDTLHTRKPTKVGLVAHHDGVVATVDHQGTDTLDTTGRTAANSDMQIPFLLSQYRRDGSQPNDGIACDPQPIENPHLNMIRKTMDVNKS